MQNLNELAKQYFAFEKVDISDFQRKARILQSMWREEKGYEIGEFRERKIGNYLPMPWAKETLNNYLSDTIRKVVIGELQNSKDNGKLYGKPRIYNNLLSSQPLCFNLFAELKENLTLATKVFKKLSNRVKKVLAIEFEHSPGRRNSKYTGDRSAFDVYVEYLTSEDKKGFIGIEVKYHENLKNEPADIKPRYTEVAYEMKCFKDDCIEKLKTSPLEQVWRDHLLAGSLLNSEDGFEDGFFVFLFPKDNLHCQKAVNEYKQCLTEDRTFQGWTLEDVAEVIKQNTDDKWIDGVIDRYLNFGKIEFTSQEEVNI